MYACQCDRLVLEYLLSFFFNDTATTEIYTLSLHDALPIYHHDVVHKQYHLERDHQLDDEYHDVVDHHHDQRDHQLISYEHHTSDLHPQPHLVYHLLLEQDIDHDDGAIGHDAQRTTQPLRGP